MDMATFVRVMDDIERLDFRKLLVFVGGEPTLHPQFEEFALVAIRRGFFIKTYSNGYTAASRRLLYSLRTRVWYTSSSFKIEGNADNQGEQFIFCAPRDLPQVRRATCSWETICGYGVDVFGYSPCTMGCMISHWQCPETRTWDLAKIQDPEWVEYVKQRICSYCGSFLEITDPEGLGLVKKYNTWMSESWAKVFE
jgi:hypothetical protein